jgi:ubiquinone/menaquinone biosynthesis C-methylase UbiE
MLLNTNPSSKINPQRESFFDVKFADPQSIVEKLEINSGMAVADFGCGAGFFSLPIAKKVGEEGKVYALDIIPAKLESVESQAKDLNLNNIITQRVNLESPEGSKLAADSLDWVIMKDILFQNKGKDKILKEAKRILKKGGQALIIEWNKEDTNIGPEKELRIFKETLVDLSRKNGWTIDKEIEAGTFHYGLILKK